MGRAGTLTGENGVMSHSLFDPVDDVLGRGSVVLIMVEELPFPRRQKERCALNMLALHQHRKESTHWGKTEFQNKTNYGTMQHE